jgi:cytochrome c peroxidase
MATRMLKHSVTYAAALSFVTLCGCGDSVLAPLTDMPLPAGFAETAAQTAPPDNALTEDRAQLGKRLFYDKLLSRDSSIACASCHQQEHGFADPRPVSEGVQGRKGKRNASQLANLAWVRTGLFWDGRAATLEEQSIKPIEDHNEMDLPVAEAVARLAADKAYADAFARAYGGPPTVELLKKAMASFLRTLVSSDSRYDRYLKGDKAAFTPNEKRGRDLFFGGKTGCFHCHSETTLTNDGFFNNGSYEDGGDVGRQALTMKTGDLGAFRVPNLRNIEVTAPYMHDGSLPTLESVVEQYSRGGRGHPSTDAQIEPLTLNAEEKADLVAFLRTFTDQTFLRDSRFRP